MKIYGFAILYIIMWLPNGENFLRYADECIALFCLIGLLIALATRKRFNIEAVVICSCVLILMIFGLLGTLIANIGQRLFAIAVDAFSLLKMPISYIYFKYIFSSYQKRKFVDLMFPFASAIVVIAFLCGIINLFFDIGMDYDIRFGIKSFQFVYNNPGALGALMFACYAIFVMKSDNRYVLLKVLAGLVILLTFRSGCIGALGVLVVFNVFIKSKVKMRHIIFAIIIAFLLGYSQLINYFFSGGTLRSTLVAGGIEVFKLYFPFGAGFASYGSDMAYRYYSPVYYEIGFDKIWGLNLINGSVINDNFWPMLLGQFGFVGVTCYLIILLVQFSYMLKANVTKSQKSIALSLYALLFIGSLGAAIYTSDMGVSLIMMFVFASTVKRDRPVLSRRFNGVKNEISCCNGRNNIQWNI